jgi:hypothetical protein
MTWESFLHSSPNPLAPTVGDVVAEALSAAEQWRFEARLRPLVEQGVMTYRLATADLWATKPR